MVPRSRSLQWLGVRFNQTLDTVLAGPGHVVLLEDPRHLGNLGAVIRVAAAAGASGVMTTGRQDPWHPDAIRGSAGLHFALPVHHIQAVRTGDRELVALDPAGKPLASAEVPACRSTSSPSAPSVTDRGDQLLAHCAAAVGVAPPVMSAGVSSLNRCSHGLSPRPHVRTQTHTAGSQAIRLWC